MAVRLGAPGALAGGGRAARDGGIGRPPRTGHGVRGDRRGAPGEEAALRFALVDADVRAAGRIGDVEQTLGEGAELEVLVSL